MFVRRVAWLLLGVASLFLVFAVGMWLRTQNSDQAIATNTADAASLPTVGSMDWVGTGPMSLGRFTATVSFDKEQDYYFLELQGTRLPFKSSPIQAQTVPLEAEGKSLLDKNTALLYGILGEEVIQVSILVNPDEGAEVMPAAMDVARYVQMVNASKFGGVHYTKPPADTLQASTAHAEVRSVKDANAKTPVIELRGPNSGATQTRVAVTGEGRVLVEGTTYEDLYRAADLVAISLLKMLCGSPDCPDASACATSGDCGCG